MEKEKSVARLILAIFIGFVTAVALADEINPNRTASGPSRVDPKKYKPYVDLEDVRRNKETIKRLISEAESKAKGKWEATAEYAAIKTELDAKRLNLETARASGTQQQRFDAGASYNEVVARLQKAEKAVTQPASDLLQNELAVINTIEKSEVDERAKIHREAMQSPEVQSLIESKKKGGTPDFIKLIDKNIKSAVDDFELRINEARKQRTPLKLAKGMSYDQVLRMAIKLVRTTETEDGKTCLFEDETWPGRQISVTFKNDKVLSFIITTPHQ